MGTKITGIGDDGMPTTSGDIGVMEIDGSLTIGNANTDNVVFNADINSHIIPNADASFDIGTSSVLWRDIYTKGITGSGSLVLQTLQNISKKTLQGTSAATAVLEDTTFSGIGTNNFTISCWFYQNDTNSDPISTNTQVRIMYSSYLYILDLRFPDIAIVYENASGTTDQADFDTNLENGKWYHIVAYFDVANLSTGQPRLWIDGVEISGQNYSAVGGTSLDINRVQVYLDDGTAMQDLVFWDKLLSTEEIAEIYNSGYYQNPSFTSISGNIISWFQLGEESALSGFSPGSALSGTIDLNDAIGSNSFTLTLESEFSILGREMQEITNPGVEINSISLRINSSHTPSSASDFGKEGEIAWDTNYIYICVGTNTWKRVGISTW